MTGMTGIKDIAEAAGVSLATVSNVINGKPNVGKKTREKILQLIKEMDYVPNEAGKLLKTGENRTVLFVFSDFDRSFYLEILKGVNDYLKNKDYDLLICTQRSCEKYMRNNMSSGCIVLDAGVRNDIIRRCANENYPIVTLDRTSESPYVKSVVVDNYPPMCEMVQEMIDRGYRRFAFLSGVETSLDNMDRYRGFRDTLEKNGLRFDQKNYFVGDYREDSGYTVGKILSLTEHLPDALICANDSMAIGVIRAFKENGIHVPEDIAVTGFDDIDRAREIGLTTITVPDYERGYLAARYLMEALQGKEVEKTFQIATKVKMRKTVSVKRKVK